MKLDHVRSLLLSRPGTSAGMPFGPSALVFKILEQRVFAILQWQEEPLRLSLKCDPDLALMLCARYVCVVPGYHLNKRHWITITLEGTLPEADIMQWICASYDLVCERFSRLDKKRLEHPAAK